MPTKDRALQLIEDAKRLSAQGRLSDAAGLLQSLIFDIGRSTELRDVKGSAYTGLIQILFVDGREGRLSKVFKGAVAEFSEFPDPAFDDLYLRGARRTDTAPVPLRRRDRFLHLLRQLETARELPGLVAECGCFRGLSSYLMCSRLREHNPAFDGTGYQIYDSFQGLSEPTQEDKDAPDSEEFRRVSKNMKPGMYKAPLEHVRQVLAPFPGISFNPGWIPAAFPAGASTPYRFVHVDVDLYQPTLASFEYFWPLLVPGGTILCDDYNWAGAKRAVHEFCERQGVEVRVTAANQAYFCRPA